MKRLVVVIVSMLALGLGTSGIATAGSPSPPQPSLGKIGKGTETGTTTIHFGQPPAGTVTTQGSDLECAVQLTFVGVDVVGAYFGGPILAWFSGAGAVYSGSQIADNRTCAAASFYDHLGWRQVCYVDHFKFWSPNGTAVFDSGLGACLHSPAELDSFFCQFLHPQQYADACYWQIIYDIATNAWQIISPF